MSNFKKGFLVVFVVALSLAPYIAMAAIPKPPASVTLDYGAFYINYSCTRLGYNYAGYSTVPDQGDFKRYEPFHKDPRVALKGCLPQYSTRAYSRPKGQTQYDRGHGVHQNIWDHDRKVMKLTNFMTNIVPQQRYQNRRGLWRKLETRVECARDLKDEFGRTTSTQVMLGNLWGNDTSNDHFRLSHGVVTPDYLWRVHVYPDRPNQAYAWIIPNTKEATLETEARYRVSMAEIVAHVEYDLPFPEAWVDAQGEDPHRNLRCSWK